MRLIPILLLCVLALASCSLVDQYCKEHPYVKYEYLPAIESCLIEPPIENLPVTPTVDGTCPSQFALCLDVDAGLTLEHNLRAQKRWALEAWTRCKPSDASIPKDGGM